LQKLFDAYNPVAVAELEHAVLVHGVDTMADNATLSLLFAGKCDDRPPTWH
jgi:hypothetical protein